jgi:RNA polymerase sigma-70 factor (ECF subfamily)
VVLESRTASSDRGKAALEQLCRTYWRPIYGYLRHRGFTLHDAEDLTQQFLADLLQRDGLDTVHPSKGRFRSFLLASINNFLSNVRDRQLAAKRGGGQPHLSLSDPAVEATYLSERADHLTPELLYDRHWALTVLDKVHERLEEEMVAFGKSERIQALAGFLPGRHSRRTYAEVAAGLNLSEGSVKVEVHRLRGRFRKLLRQEIAATVQAPHEVDDELRQLIESLSMH